MLAIAMFHSQRHPSQQYTLVINKNLYNLHVSINVFASILCP